MSIPKGCHPLYVFLALNRKYWGILPEEMQLVLQKWVKVKNRPEKSEKYPRNFYSTLLKAATIVIANKKREYFLDYGYDYLEGLDLQTTHPELFHFLKRLKIYSIHQLSSFIDTIRSPNNTNFRIQYPQTLEIIEWWDTTGNEMARHSPTKSLPE